MKKLLSMVTILALSSVGAMAAGTTKGTNITNTATLSFSVEGVTQTPVISNEDSFVVDKKIDFVLTHNDNPKHLIVVANDENKERSFTLVNESNDVQKYSLSVSNLSGDTYDSKVDDAEMQNLEFSVDGGDWTSGPLVIDAISVDGNVTVVVRGDILESATDGEVMNIQLEAIAVDASGDAEVDSKDNVDNKAAVDIVLGEGTGVSDFGNTPFDGKYTAWAGYLVNTPNVDLTKLSCVLKDEVRNGVNSKRIPGATVVYVFDLNNTSASTDATGITLSDTLSTDYDLSGTVASVKSAEDKTEACTCTYGDAEGGNGGNDIHANASLSTQDLTLESLSVAKNSHTCVSFQVKIK